MTDATTQLTIATSTGAVWLSLLMHFGTGLLALGSGFVAVVVAKGGPLHRRAGMVFVFAMIAVGFFAAGLALVEHKVSSVIGGLFTAYLVFSGYTTVKPLTGRYARGVNVTVMLVGSVLALVQFTFAVMALSSQKQTLSGVPVPMIVFLGSVALLAAIGDWRLMHAGSISGASRLARHLWRMCFGLFTASGSFFLGQMKFLPTALHIMPLLGALTVAPLHVLLYWMWRIRFRKKLHGVTLRASYAAR